MQKQITIKPPNGCLEKDINKSIDMTDEKIIVTLTYPNGFVVQSTIIGDEQNIVTSGDLIDLGDGVFQVPN